jgi:predicted DNA-binding transcriptional regulator YafY
MPQNPSEAFRLLHRAILERKQVTCTYGGFPRELCPVVLGHKADEAMLLAYQFGGKSHRALPEWRCFRVAEMTDIALRDGPWVADSQHRSTQTCVDSVTIDVNIAVPNQPGRRGL